jgi:hypothetical protein
MVPFSNASRQLISPPGPRALNSITQSRTIWCVTPLIRARQRQQSPRLRAVLAATCFGQHLRPVEIGPERTGMANLLRSPR